MIGSPDGVLVKGARRSAVEHNLEHQVLSAGELRARFPCFSPERNMVGVWEPRAGILMPELAVRMHLELAKERGATLRFDEPVLRWETNGDCVRVFTAKGVYDGKQLVLSAGSWLSSLLAGAHDSGNRSIARLPLSVERQVLLWFEPRAQAKQFQPENCPIHIWEYAPNRFFYGFPDLGGGVKVAIHHEGETIGPRDIRREISEGEIQAMRSILRRFMPAADGSFKSATVCMYTNTPDQHFVLD